MLLALSRITPTGQLEGRELQTIGCQKVSGMTKKLVKALLSVNLAIIIRAVRFGIRDAVAKLTTTYQIISPFDTGLSILQTIRQVELSELIRDFPTIILDSSYRYVDGALPLHEQTALLAILRDRNPSVVLEIGTFFGTTTKAMSLNLPDSIIHTVDLPLGIDYESQNDPQMPKDDLHLITNRRVGAAFESHSACRNVVQHFADTAKWDFTEAKAASFFFIDGSHTYEYVRNDTLKCLHSSLGLSTLVWHDCDHNHTGVVRWLAEMAANGFPIVRIRGTSLAVLDYQPTERLSVFLNQACRNLASVNAQAGCALGRTD